MGTTAVRTLESAAIDGQVQGGYGETNLFIKPGYSFKIIDSLITNFHLPKSTLFVLVSQLAGRQKMLDAYEHAKNKGYKFFQLRRCDLYKIKILFQEKIKSVLSLNSH